MWIHCNRNTQQSSGMWNEVSGVQYDLVCGFIFLQLTATASNFIEIKRFNSPYDFILNITFQYGIVKIK